MDSNRIELNEPRFPGVSRRAFLRGSAGVGLAALAVPVLASCGGASSATSGSNTPATTAGSTSTPDSAAPAPSDSTAATPAPATADSAAVDTPATADAAAQGAAFADGRRLQVDFTFAAGGGGRVHNPYIAVWIEDPTGELVQTISLWYKSDEGKYLRDLKRWNSKNNTDAITTGATRIPGSFSVAWDGTDLGGGIAADGDYFVCVEAARENGPYQIIRESVSISSAMPPTTFTPNGELTACSVALVA